MAKKKKPYEKPVIQDLGQVLSASGQVSPMGICRVGTSPSGSAQQCQNGRNVKEDCSLGIVFEFPWEVCTGGGAASAFCARGLNVGNCRRGASF